MELRLHPLSLSACFRLCSFTLSLPGILRLCARDPGATVERLKPTRGARPSSGRSQATSQSQEIAGSKVGPPEQWQDKELRARGESNSRFTERDQGTEETQKLSNSDQTGVAKAQDGSHTDWGPTLCPATYCAAVSGSFKLSLPLLPLLQMGAMVSSCKAL